MWRKAWDKGKNKMCEIFVDESTDVSCDRVVEKAENTSFGFFNSQHSCLCLLHSSRLQGPAGCKGKGDGIKTNTEPNKEPGVYFDWHRLQLS